MASVTDHRVRAFEPSSKDLLKHIFCDLIRQGMINDYVSDCFRYSGTNLA